MSARSLAFVQVPLLVGVGHAVAEDLVAARAQPAGMSGAIS
jgi:hypothetical protein